jgi:hypothetical protein
VVVPYENPVFEGTFVDQEIVAPVKVMSHEEI